MARRLIIGARVSGSGAIYALARVGLSHVRAPMVRREGSEWATTGVSLPDTGELDISVVSDTTATIHAFHVRVIPDLRS